MKEGVSKSLETLSEIGGKVQEEAVKAGYGPTIRADAVKKLVEFGGELPGALAARSSTKCASSRRRTRPRSAMRSKTASGGSPSSSPTARRSRSDAPAERAVADGCRRRRCPAAAR